MACGDEEKAGEENAGGRDQCSANATEQITDERRGSEYWSGRNLTDCDGVELLHLSQPMQPINKIGLKKRQQYVTASEDDGAKFQKNDE